MEGTLHEKDGRYVVRFERRLAHPPEKVWRAITDPDQLASWFPADIEGDREVGGRLRFVMREGDDGGEGEVTEHDPPRLFEYTWGGQVLRWELRPDGEDGCILVLTNTVDDRDQATWNAAGWHACLDALESLLASRPLDWAMVHGQAAELHEDYARSFV
jgi:uncharacterized protein YndB with AHSA1/START domain